MSFIKKINIFLNDAFSEGVIDQDTKQKLDNFAKNYKGKSISSFLNIIVFFGGFIIILGLIMVISKNWNQFSNFAKISTYITLLIGFNILAYMLQKTSPITSRIIYFIIAGYILAGIGLIAQIFHLNIEIDEAFLLWFFMILPMAILLRHGWIGAMAMLSFYYWTSINANDNFYNYEKNFQNKLLFYTTIFSSMILISRSLTTLKHSFEKLKYFGYFSLGFVTFFMSFSHKIFSEQSSKISPSLHPITIAIIAFNIICLTNNCIKVFRKRAKFLDVVQTPEFIIILLNIFSLFVFTNRYIMTSILYSLVWFVGFGLMIYRGEIEKNKTMINVGIWCIMIGIIARFIDLIGTMLFTGSMFILFGTILILIAFLAEKYRKNLINKIFK